MYQIDVRFSMVLVCLPNVNAEARHVARSSVE
jgi:hypothetical protein